MKLDKLKPKLKSLGRQLGKYRYLLIGLTIIGVFVYTVNIINSELTPNRDQAAYEEAKLNIGKVEFNEEAVKTIVRLRDLNIDVDAIFAPGRTNPFE